MSVDRGAAEARSVQLRYVDSSGVERDASDETLGAVLAAMGEPPGDGHPLVVHEGNGWRIEGAVEVETEDHRTVAAEDEVPHDLPLGYHTLRFRDGASQRLIVTPDRCVLPSQRRGWGWAVQLYAARSESSWGIGDLGDLRDIARASGDREPSMLLLNPLHAALPGVPQQPSPYYPSSRRFRNPLYIRVEDVPGAKALMADLEPLAQAGRALLKDRRIDRDAVYRLKFEALERIWRESRGDERFDAFRAEGGDDLDRYAAFCVLSEQHGRPWHAWPEEYRHPTSEAVRAFADANRERVDFHAFLQWLVDEQLRQSAAAVPLVNDLAVGADPDGADAWLWQDVVASGIEVGAPPDDFNTLGQKWGFPPFDPARLRAAGYEPFVQTLRSAFRHSAGIRLDHVLGLFRLFWIPVGAEAPDGVYVRYPASELLDIVALESRRAGAFVVGEDLGTLEPGVREELASRGLLSYRVFWFEDRAPAEYPEQALAAVTTHDLPTIAGLWTGADVRTQEELALQPNLASNNAARERLERYAGVHDGMPVAEVVEHAYSALAGSPSLLVAATLEDVLGVEERPNMPGTTNDRWPNWSLALPQPISALRASDVAKSVAEELSGRQEPGD